MPLQLDSTLVTLAAVFLIFALAVYGNLLSRLRREGGKVRTSEFALPDLLVSIVLAGTLTAVVLRLATIRAEGAAAPVSISPEQILPNQVLYVVLFAGIASFCTGGE